MGDKNDSIPLVNKYEPTEYSNIILNSGLKNLLNNVIKHGVIKNIILHGPHGCGKTLLSKLLTKELLKEYYSPNNTFLDLNTIRDKGLKNLQEVIPMFCQIKCNNDYTGKRIIIIDEADNLTKKTQNMINDNIKKFNDRISFIFTCNDCKKIDPAIISECLALNINSHLSSDIVTLLQDICNKENIKYSSEGLKLIADSSNGDIRASINLLDCVRTGYDTIVSKNIKQLLYSPCTHNINALITHCNEKNLYACIAFIHDLHKKGFSNSDIIISTIEVTKTISLPEETKIKYIDIMTKYYIRMSDGLDSNLQLYGCFGEIICD